MAALHRARHSCVPDFRLVSFSGFQEQRGAEESEGSFFPVMGRWLWQRGSKPSHTSNMNCKSSQGPSAEVQPPPCCLRIAVTLILQVRYEDMWHSRG